MSRNKYLQRVVHLSLVAATVSLALPANAQQATPEKSVGTLGEVIVTAQKREESLTEVTIPISVFTSEQRDQLGISSVVDMANFTPGFVYNQGQDRVSIRGIGRYTNQLGADSSVGVYEDGVFETFTVKAGNSSLYTDRIEILRGPQGTLYGRNSIGGAVNIISRRPTKDWYFEGRLSEDNYNNHVEEGAVSGPLIADHLQFRLIATKYDQTKGYFKNIGVNANGDKGRDSGNVRDEWAYEGQLAAQFGDSDDAWLKLFGGQWNNGGGNAGGRTSNQVIVDLEGNTPTADGKYPANGPGFTATTDPLVPSLGAGFRPSVIAGSQTGSNTTGVNPGNNNIREIYSTYDQYVKVRDYYGAILQYNHHFSFADLKYIGGIQHYDYSERLDYAENFAMSSGLNSFQNTGQARVFPGSVLDYGEKHSLNSNEVNLVSTGSGPVQYVAGIYNFNEYFKQPEEIALPGQSELATPFAYIPFVFAGGTRVATPANPNRDVVYQEGDGGGRTWAAYGQVDWSLTDAWKLTGGARYSKDWKWGNDRARLLIFVPAFGAALDLSPVTAISAQTTYPGATAPVLDPATGIWTRRLEGEWSGVTGTGGIQWTPTAQSNLYFKVSRGYKSGGFNIGSGIAPNPKTDPEHSIDYQLGYKQNFGTFQLNVDVFYDSYKNAQIPIGAVGASGLIAVQFYNIPDARSDGIEIETVWQPIHELQFILNYGYNHTEILNSGCIVDAAGDPTATLIGHQTTGCSVAGTQNLKGNQLPNAPKQKAALNGNYTFDFGASSLTFSATYLWRDATYGSVFNRPYTKAPSWNQTDMRVQFKTFQDHLTVIAFGKNVFDKLGYSTGAFGVVQNDGGTPASGGNPAIAPAPVAFVKNYQLTPPRIYGLELQYKF